MFKTAMTAVLGLALAACVSHGHALGAYRNGEGLRSLTGLELQRLLPGYAMRSRDPSRLSDAPTGRAFHLDGTFTDIGPRGGAGRYEIRGDAVCHDYDRPRGWQCEHIYVADEGTYFGYSDLLVVGGKPPYYAIDFKPIDASSP